MKFNKIKMDSGFIQFIRKKENIKTIVLIALVILVLFLIQLLKGNGFTGKYIEDKNGNIVGVLKNSEDEDLSVPIKYSFSEGDKLTEEERLLYLSGGKNDETTKEKDEEKSLEAQMEDAIYDIENTSDQKIYFPSELEDGTKISWAKPSKNINIQILLFFPVIVLLLYKNSLGKEKKAKVDIKKEIESSLPMFNNQLLLLLNSGLIFNDAFKRIALGYKMKEENKLKALEKGIVEIYDKSVDTNSSLIALMIEYSKKIEVKEFSRLVSIISDNQYKGVNLSDKLEVESGILWEQRKKNAEEKGKLAETKLTFPLALLLLVLILITAAPAILQI